MLILWYWIIQKRKNYVKNDDLSKLKNILNDMGDNLVKNIGENLNFRT